MSVDEFQYVCSRCGAMFRAPTVTCLFCGTMHSVQQTFLRPASQLWPANASCESAATLVHQKGNLQSSRAYPELMFGKAPLMMFYGPPGAGKSTMLMKLLDGIEGPVLMVSLEEGLSETLIGKLKWLEITRNDFFVSSVHTVDELDELLTSKSVVAVGIDSLSVSTLRLDDLLRIRQTLQIPIMATLHITKAGIPAGEMTILHGADIVVHVETMKWAVEKSRFGKPVFGEV